MEFNNLVKSTLYPIFRKYGFENKEEFNNILHFESINVGIRIIHNNYENSCSISIGKKREILYPLDNITINSFFDFGLPIENISTKDFINNLSLFFEINKKAIDILRGDINSFIDFELEKINNYNLVLFQKQALNKAEKAWQQNDYENFMNIINELNYEKLPKPYLLKYKIAKQKLNR